MKKYISITIGPIFETMNFVSSPSALWAASYMFSYISRRICEIITNNEKYGNVKIITPFYNPDNKLIKENNGIGLFHDRVIFEKPKGFNVTEDIREIKKAIIEDLCVKFDFSDGYNYLMEYVMISAVEIEADNPIIESENILTSFELSKSFVAKETTNPIISVFTSEDSGSSSKNKAIIKIVKDNLHIKGWQLLKDSEKGIKELSSISNIDKEDRKYNDYCAIVRADGDRIGYVISQLKEFNDFSEVCFNYCDAASKLVEEYGGVTIFAGGDDLLAIMPCKSEKGTLLDFSLNLSQKFNEAFQEYILKDNITNPSLSIGMFIFYNKFPLYEALNESVDVLFETAKSRRNCVAIKLQKHAGQTSQIIIPNNSLATAIELQNEVLKNNDEIIMSSLQKISLFEYLFDSVESDEQVNNLFKNLFDAYGHSGNNFLHEILPKYYNLFRNEQEAPLYDKDPNSKFADTFSNYMRILKFYLEKKGKK